MCEGNANRISLMQCALACIIRVRIAASSADRYGCY